jgi:hypothetical protein
LRYVTCDKVYFGNNLAHSHALFGENDGFGVGTSSMVPLKMFLQDLLQLRDLRLPFL